MSRRELPIGPSASRLAKRLGCKTTFAEAFAELRATDDPGLLGELLVGATWRAGNNEGDREHGSIRPGDLFEDAYMTGGHHELTGGRQEALLLYLEKAASEPPKIAVPR